MIVGCSNSQKLARKIAKQLKTEFSELIIKHFPDGETYLRFKTSVKNKEVVLVQTLQPKPNDALIELIFAAKTAKELGAKKIILVAPYMAYLRQDKRFHSGECVSNKIISELLSCADQVITIDPHLHRIKKLSEIFKTKTTALSANKTIAEYIQKNHSKAIIVGPDEESYQWAETIAEQIKSHAVILRKKRYSSRTVRIKVKQNIEWKGKTIVIVDDIISTGHTVIEPIKQLQKYGVKKIVCICVHGLFAEDALLQLKKLGIEIISTNTIQNPVAKIDVSRMIAEGLRKSK